MNVNQMRKYISLDSHKLMHCQLAKVYADNPSERKAHILEALRIRKQMQEMKRSSVKGCNDGLHCFLGGKCFHCGVVKL